MAWTKSTAGQHEPDGTPFDPPADSFEKVFNQRLAVEGAAALGGMSLAPANGFPISTRTYQSKPASAAHLRKQLDNFFAPGFQADCMTSGNTPDELDMLAKRLLAHAVMCGCPVTDREVAVSKRLGVDLAALPRQVEAPAGRVY